MPHALFEMRPPSGEMWLTICKILPASRQMLPGICRDPASISSDGLSHLLRPSEGLVRCCEVLARPCRPSRQTLEPARRSSPAGMLGPVGAAVRALTIHSSRSRFAARLNSSVMRYRVEHLRRVLLRQLPGRVQHRLRTALPIVLAIGPSTASPSTLCSGCSGLRRLRLHHAPRLLAKGHWNK
jgi:hypothetical protein